jgi:cytochrome c556
MKRLSALAVSLALVGLVSAAESARGDDDDVIDYRKHIMTTMGEQVAILDMILEKRAPAEDLAIHAQILAVTASTAKMAFEQEIQGGRAKPDVWAKWSDFEKRMDALVAATADLAKSAKGGGAAAVGPKMQALTCKSCHDAYRVPK